MLQKQTLLIEQNDIQRALEEIENTTGKIYKAIGPIMVETSKKNIKEELEDKKEEITLRLKTIQAQEKNVKAKLQEMQKKFQQ